MTLKTISIAAAALALIITAAPVFAACNPGSPHCIKFDPTGRLAKVKAKIKDPRTLGSGDQDCTNSRLCGIDTGDGSTPGTLARRSGGGKEPVAPTPAKTQ